MSGFMFKATELAQRPRAYTFDDLLLVPCRSAVRSRFDVNVETQFTRRHKLKLPVVAANMSTISEKEMCIALNEVGATAILHRFMTVEEQVKHVKAIRENMKEGWGTVSASVGVNGDSKERAKALVDAGAEIITLDIAHGHSESMIEMVGYLKKEFSELDVIAGNVATAAATEDLIRAGADAIKVGIGPGSMCTTRIITGVGMPQLSAISVCVEVAKKEGVPVIADGGIRKSGDAMKALAVGASTVMLGSVLSGTDETPGESVNGKKVYQGMASRSAQTNWRGGKLPDGMAPEGESVLVSTKGPVQNVVHEFVGGIRSGMSYLNSPVFSDIPENAYFIEVSANCLRENVAHGAI
jgi:IMP dehydrogenase